VERVRRLRVFDLSGDCSAASFLAIDEQGRLGSELSGIDCGCAGGGGFDCGGELQGIIDWIRVIRAQGS
jgi:hypothetical protein